MRLPFARPFPHAVGARKSCNRRNAGYDRNIITSGPQPIRQIHLTPLLSQYFWLLGAVSPARARRLLTSAREPDTIFSVRVSYVELYNNRFRNLLEGCAPRGGDAADRVGHVLGGSLGFGSSIGSGRGSWREPAGGGEVRVRARGVCVCVSGGVSALFP